MKAGKYQGIISFGHTPIFITLSVIDTQPPVIQNVENITTFIGEEVDLKSKVTVADNSKEDIELIVKGDYSFHKDSLGYYAVLELDSQAGAEAVKQNYRELAKKWHPDYNKAENALEVFQKLSVAYDVLQDEHQRLIYDLLSCVYDGSGFPEHLPDGQPLIGA